MLNLSEWKVLGRKIGKVVLVPVQKYSTVVGSYGYIDYFIRMNEWKSVVFGLDAVIEGKLSKGDCVSFELCENRNSKILKAFNIRKIIGPVPYQENSKNVVAVKKLLRRNLKEELEKWQERERKRKISRKG